MVTKLANIIRGALAKKDMRPRHLSLKLKENGKVKITEGYLSMWLNGNLKSQEDPSDEKILAIAEVLGLNKKEVLECSTRSSTVTNSTTHMTLKEVFDNNKESTPEIKAFLDTARNGISDKQWKKILEVASSK